MGERRDEKAPSLETSIGKGRGQPSRSLFYKGAAGKEKRGIKGI